MLQFPSHCCHCPHCPCHPAIPALLPYLLSSCCASVPAVLPIAVKLSCPITHSQTCTCSEHVSDLHPIHTDQSTVLPLAHSPSSSSSDSHPPYPSPRMSSKGRFEQIVAHNAPLVTAGDITPEVLHSWEMGCKQYFRIKTITTTDQVTNVAWNLQDLHVQDWYSNDTDYLNGLSFDAFMSEVCKTWLPSDWDTTLRQHMLGSTQGSHSFHKWAVNLQSQNTMLCSTTSHLNVKALKFHLKVHMYPNLLHKYCTCHTTHKEDFHTWLESVSLLDKEREHVHWQQRQVIELAIHDAHTATTCPLSSATSQVKGASSPTSTSEILVSLHSPAGTDC